MFFHQFIIMAICNNDAFTAAVLRWTPTTTRCISISLA